MSAAGVRVARRDDTLEPREHYGNLVAQHYADEGHVKFAELLEAGHACSACHITRSTNGVPNDDQIDLDEYTTVAALTKVAKETVQLGADFAIGLAISVEARLAAVTASRIRVVGMGTTELDAITLRHVGEEIAKNPVARAAYAQVQNQGTTVILDFETTGLGELGNASWSRNEIILYVAEHHSPRAVVSTLVHETSHITRFSRGDLNTKLDEVRAFSREFLYVYGRRPSRAERQEIWKMVRRDYASLRE